MPYLRHTLGFLGAAAMIGTATAVFAQEGNAPQMLGQMQQGEPAQPSPQPLVQPSTLPPSVPPGAYREWPGTPALATGPETGRGMIDSEGGGAIPDLPLEVQNAGNITYITGGIGDEELAQIKASEHQYNLHLLFNSDHGAFISDVNVTIADTTGANVLTAQGAGPYFYARLPVGKYTLDLNENGQDKKIPLKIGDNTNVKKAIEFNEPGGVITPHQPTATVE